MAICDRCGCEFDEDEAREQFDDEFESGDFDYDNFDKDVCGDCAIEIINNDEEGYYFETCEECGCRFDFCEEELKFNNAHGYGNGTDIRDFWDDGPLCADCALEAEEDQTEDEDE